MVLSQLNKRSTLHKHFTLTYLSFENKKVSLRFPGPNKNPLQGRTSYQLSAEAEWKLVLAVQKEILLTKSRPESKRYSTFVEKYHLNLILKACFLAVCISILSSFISALFSRNNTTIFTFHHFSLLSFFSSKLLNPTFFFFPVNPT